MICCLLLYQFFFSFRSFLFFNFFFYFHVAAYMFFTPMKHETADLHVLFSYLFHFIMQQHFKVCFMFFSPDFKFPILVLCSPILILFIFFCVFTGYCTLPSLLITTNMCSMDDMAMQNFSSIIANSRQLCM